MVYSERKRILVDRIEKKRKGGLDEIEVLIDELIEVSDRPIEDGPDDGTRALGHVVELAKILRTFVLDQQRKHLHCTYTEWTTDR